MNFKFRLRKIPRLSTKEKLLNVEKVQREKGRMLNLASGDWRKEWNGIQHRALQMWVRSVRQNTAKHQKRLEQETRVKRERMFDLENHEENRWKNRKSLLEMRLSHWNWRIRMKSQDRYFGLRSVLRGSICPAQPVQLCLLSDVTPYTILRLRWNLK